MNPHLIMPMGGAGSRFKKDGYTIPKPLIEINGKPFFYWATRSVSKFIEVKDITFVVLEKHINDFGIDASIKEHFPDGNIIAIPEVLPGPVYTAIEGVRSLEDDAPVIFNDCDHMFRCNKLEETMRQEQMEEDGILLTFESDKACYSYVKYKDKKIIGTAEKQVVSNHAICGAYIFKNKRLFIEASDKYLSNCPYKECFMSGLYNILCDESKNIKDHLLDFHVEFGTPEEYEEAQKSNYFTELR